MVRTFIVELLLTAPCIITIVYVCVSMLKRDFKISKTMRTTIVISVGMMAILIVARAMPFLSYKLSPPRDTVAEQSNALNRKNDFMKILDQVIADPAKLNAETKRKLFEEFKDLFPNGAKDKQIYFQNLSALVECNRAYFQDALLALKTKTNQKSEKRKQCLDLDGMFYNRPKLIAEEQAKVNDQVIETIAKGKQIIENNKPVEINEGVLQQAIETQTRNLDALKIIFSEGP